jgi:DNA-binding response OmpR family regulator
MPQTARIKGEHSPKPRGSPQAKTVPLAPRKHRLIVADDDPALRRALVIALERDGYRVLEADDGSALLDLLGDAVLSADPDPLALDLIITDVRMPGFTGLQALAAIRQLAWDTPCIVISAFLTPDLEAQALRLGAAAVFKKPFDVDDLRAAVTSLVRQPTGK